MPERSVLDLIRRRRSIPKFTGEPVPRAVVERMLEAATWAPNHLLLTALDEGVGTYPRTGGLIHDPRLRAFLDLPADRRVAAVVSVGYPAVIPERKRTPWMAFDENPGLYV